ncbi:type I-B CRISPR-associated protein Cas8b/Csh1 [Halalkalicoccus salilacus]|uniref:type I-B CRISPR-associated protein Cas8b/Csh1 n=1 Tax=Halalkalicoccus salilacus TaxID=3117459 RepID=UPI00300EC23E
MSDLDPSKLDALLPTGPVHSLRQVQAVYGALSEAASGGSTPAGQEQYSLYFTPSALEPFIANDDDEERFLISVRVDFTGDGPSYERIDVTPLSREVAPRLGLSRYPWGRGIDHSITRCGSKTSGSGASTVVTYCNECLTRWTNGNGGEPAVGRVADEHADGWLINALADLGADEEVQDRIERDVDGKINGEPRVVATVQLKLDPDDLEEPPVADEPGWFYPGEVPVFNEGMRARKTRKLVSKNINNGTSEGEAACMVTNQHGDVVGTAEDSFALFTIQHTEKFDELDREQSWREHPISADAALLLDAGTGLLDACRETRNGLGVYTLPYFTTMDQDRAALLYRTLSELQDADLEERHMVVWLQEKIEEYADRTGDESLVNALRFYVIAIRDDQGDIFVFNEKPDATIYPPREIAKAHQDTLTGASFGWIGFAQPEDWRHIHPQTTRNNVVSSIIGGSYAQDTVSFTEGSDGAMANEPSEWLTFAMLAGERIDREWLLDQYVTRLAQQRERDDEGRLSENHVLTQFAQLDALAGAGLLAGPDGHENGRRMTDMDRSPTTDDVSNSMAGLPGIEELITEGVPSLAEIREYRLREFLAERAELNGDDEESEQRRGAFLIGVLLGQLSTHQRKDRNMNRTFANRYQAEDITLGQLQKVMTELLSKDSVYEAEHRYSRDGSCFPETSSRLSELAGTPPSKWSLSLPDVRFHFALGVTYGLHARNGAFELRELIENDIGDEHPDDEDVNTQQTDATH